MIWLRASGDYVPSPGGEASGCVARLDPYAWESSATRRGCRRGQLLLLFLHSSRRDLALGGNSYAARIITALECVRFPWHAVFTAPPPVKLARGNLSLDSNNDNTSGNSPRAEAP
ncbi:hypothetical protein K0M31_007988 [Melipona bicolor]|uniref:Uncharacterized protein n=1 Tax=Melipona bicolor TaxID=60889 RepID=A0AA40GCF9_9HYME|nr:hypothetical protein K0M31_007988 [Melipona bicolor]